MLIGVENISGNDDLNIMFININLLKFSKNCQRILSTKLRLYKSILF